MIGLSYRGILNTVIGRVSLERSVALVTRGRAQLNSASTFNRAAAKCYRVEPTVLRGYRYCVATARISCLSTRLHRGDPSRKPNWGHIGGAYLHHGEPGRVPEANVP